MIPTTESENQERLLTYLRSNFTSNGKSTMVLLDADRTLYEGDTSRILNEKAQINLAEIKKGFETHGYTYPGFYLMDQIYSRVEIARYHQYCEEIAQTTEFYPGVEKFLMDVKQIADVVVVSGGIKAILDALFSYKKLTTIPRIAGTHFQLDNFLIGRNEKGLICDYFKSQYKRVIAFGDSDVDSLMLQKAHHAVIVVNHHNNKDLLPNLQCHTALSQISFKGFLHPGIPTTSFQEFILSYPNLFSNQN